MANDLCPVCGANPCYGICPTQDPYHGDQAAEEADYSFNARYDDVRERYSGDEIDAAAEEAWDKDHPDDDVPLDGNEDDYGDPTDAEVRRARQSNIDNNRVTRLHGGDDSIPF